MVQEFFYTNKISNAVAAIAIIHRDTEIINNTAMKYYDQQETNIPSLQLATNNHLIC